MRGVANGDIAEAARVHVKTVSQWLNDRQPMKPENIAAVASYLDVTEAWLRYGEGEPPGGGSARNGAGPEGDALLRLGRRRLDPRVYEVVYGYLQRLEEAGVPEEMIDEAERLMVDYSYSKLHARGRPDRSVDDIILDVRASWHAIHESLTEDGFRLGPR